MADRDVTAKHEFPNAPEATSDFNDAVTKPDTPATSDQAHGTASSAGDARRATPELQPHLRPDDKQLVKEVHQQVDEEIEGPTPW